MDIGIFRIKDHQNDLVGTLFSSSIQLYDSNVTDVITVEQTGNAVTPESRTAPTDLFQIYPNPSSGQLQFDFNLSVSGRLQILDMHGRVLEQIRVKDGQYQMQKDFSHLSSGVYTCRLQLEDRVWSKLFVLVE